MQHLAQRQQFASAFLKDFILASPGSVQGLRVTQNHAICTIRQEVASMRRKTRTKKPNRHKTKLGLPDLEHVKSAVLVSLRSPESQRSYRHSIEDLARLAGSSPWRFSPSARRIP